jgi:hypothetical protein
MFEKPLPNRLDRRAGHAGGCLVEIDQRVSAIRFLWRQTKDQ